MKWLLLSAYLLLSPAWAWAQGSKSNIVNITTLEGLSHNNVQCIFEDSRGFIWVGTTDGLNRYDGHSFQPYHMQSELPASLRGNSIHYISEDENQILWIATRAHEVCYFDLKTERFVPAEELPLAYQLPSGFVFFEVKHSGKGEHWISGQGDILLSGPYGVRSLKQEEIIPAKIEIDLPHMESNHPDTVWVGLKSGCLLRLSKSFGNEIDMVYSENHVEFHELLLHNEVLIMATSKGLYAKFPWRKKAQKINELISFHLHIQDAKLWVCGHEGIWEYQLDSLLSPFEEKNTAISPSVLSAYVHGRKFPEFPDHINDIYQDRSGIIWLGSKGNGLIQFNSRPDKFHLYSLGGDQPHPEEDTSYLGDHKGRIWLGSEGRGMFQLKHSANGPRQIRAVHPFPDPHRFIYRLSEFQIAGRSYLFQGAHYPSRPKILEMKGDSLIEAFNFSKILEKRGTFTDIKQDSPWIWISAYNRGIYRYNYLLDEVFTIRVPGDTGEFTNFKTRSILLDAKGNLWVGGSQGLILIPTEEKAKNRPAMTIFKHKPHIKNSLSNDYVLPLLESSTGEIWIGTMGGGLNRWIEETQSFEHWTTKDGLPSNTIKGILEDDQGNLWVSSNKGLSQFKIAERNFINYDPSDGLQDHEFTDFACYKGKNGEMYFGGIRGLNVFFPKNIRQDSSITPIVLTEIQVLNKRMKPLQPLNGRILLSENLHETKYIHLRHDEHTFTLSFVGLNFRAPQKVRYRYQLVGFDESWVHTDANARFAKYTKIPSGKYTFKVQASNMDGVWNGPIKTLAISVATPWWKSRMAYMCYFLLFVCVVIFFQQYSLIRVQKKNELLMQAFEKQKVQELAQMKLQFFANVSHEFRTPLTLIQGYVEKVMNRVGHNIQKDLGIIKRNTSILLKLISELMDLQKMEQGGEEDAFVLCDLTDLLKESLHSFQWWAQQKEIHLETNLPEKDLMIWADPHKIERVCYNLLSNAIKYSPHGGKISVVLKEKEREVYLSVQDAGPGIPEKDQDYVFKRFYQATNAKELKQMGTGIGLAYSKAIIERHKGTLSFQSTEGVGTTFYLVLQKRNMPLSELAIGNSQQVYAPTESGKDWSHVSTKNIKTDSHVPLTEEAPHILLLEDNAQIRSMLREILENRYHIYEQEEGEKAIAFCVAHQPDLVISDVMMPGMDGFAFCHALKENPQISHIPVILLTAKDGVEMKQKGFEQGADAYITKPFEIEVLTAQIKAMLASRNKLKKKVNESGFKIELKDPEMLPSDAHFMEAVRKVMDVHLEDPAFSVVQFAENLHISKSTFNRKLKSITGQTALGFMREYRIKLAAQLLTQSDLSVKEVFFKTGIANMKSFRSYFKKAHGMNPNEYRKKANATTNV